MRATGGVAAGGGQPFAAPGERKPLSTIAAPTTGLRWPSDLPGGPDKQRYGHGSKPESEFRRQSADSMERPLILRM